MGILFDMRAPITRLEPRRDPRLRRLWARSSRVPELGLAQSSRAPRAQLPMSSQGPKRVPRKIQCFVPFPLLTELDLAYHRVSAQ